jgi:hypothetical protein
MEKNMLEESVNDYENNNEEEAENALDDIISTDMNEGENDDSPVRDDEE